ncbi:MAG: hypothetical protein IKS23_02635 [Alphaproteobacteria bacterium]|nr:hypothetical protein [Alphaproteobacteria bacterium]
MKTELNIKQLFIDVLSFIGKNCFLLSLFGLACYTASFLSLKFMFKHQGVMMFSYALFCYAFYYLFISLYYEQKPIITSEKIVNSIVKMAVVFAVSLSVVIFGHLFLKLLKYMAQWLIGFPDIYEFLKQVYTFLNNSKIGQFLLYIPLIFLLTFTFFIPGFTWVSSLNGKDASLWSAYSKTQGNYIKIVIVLLIVYAFLPFALSLLAKPTPIGLSITHAIKTIIQLVFYIRLYDFFYED